jgi:hypothetical protein
MKDFVPYQEALELKQLGFDEPCFGRYWHEELKLVNIDKQFEVPNYACLSPLYQQAFRWFRGKYQIDSWIYSNLNGLYSVSNVKRGVGLYSVSNVRRGKGLGKVSEYQTYEEAELECLKKLIDIVKNDQK